MGRSISQNKQTDLGIPQGGVLGVTLFLVAINCILENGVDRSLFADDLAIYYTTRSPRVASRALQGVTNKLDSLAAERGLTFSTNKTVNMIFRKRNEEIMLRNKIIPFKESIQFLGMTLDGRLNWEEHINKLRAKAMRALNTIRVVTSKKLAGDLKTLKKQNSAICRTKIDYSC